MPNTRLSLASRLRGGAALAYAKFQSVPPILTLPAIGLAAWFIAPYVLKPTTMGRSAAVSRTTDAGGTTSVSRTEPVAHATTELSAPSGSEAALIARLLSTPVTAAMMPFWLPLPAPAPASAQAPAPAEASTSSTPQAKTAQQAAPQAGQRPKATVRIVESAPQRRVVMRQPTPSVPQPHRQAAVTSPPDQHYSPPVGQSPAMGGSFQQPMAVWRAPQSPYGFQQQRFYNPGRVVAPRSFGGGGFHGGRR